MGGKRVILVADDDPSIRKAYRALFESEGYATIGARDGEEAVEAFRRERPDLVMLDVMMPRKSGMAACREIRAIDAAVPVLFFTAMPSEASVVRGLGYGADDYIAKDRSPEEFLARVAAAFRRAGASGAASGEIVEIAGGTVADLARMEICGGGACGPLTRSECLAIKLLAGERGRYFSYAEVFAAVRGEGYAGDETAVRSLFSRLKRKLGRAGAAIVSGRGRGWKLI